MGTQGTILLTGPNGGIGIGFVNQLLKSPYATTHTSIYAVRSPARAHALNSLLETAPKSHNHLLLPVDLSSLANIRTFAADINARVASGAIPPIQALILNAGVEDCIQEYFTDDGYERTFAVNYLANFLLTLLLLQSVDKEHGRIIYISSTCADIDWWVNKPQYTPEQLATAITTPEKMAKGIEECPDGEGFGMKMGNRRYELQRRLDTDPVLSSISVLGLDPGWIGRTGISRNISFPIKVFLSFVWLLGHVLVLFQSNPLFRTVNTNGDDLLSLCFENKFGEHPKQRYVNGKVEKETHKVTRDEEAQHVLWKSSLGFAELKDGDTVLQNWR